MFQEIEFPFGFYDFKKLEIMYLCWYDVRNRYLGFCNIIVEDLRVKFDETRRQNYAESKYLLDRSIDP